MAYPRSLRNDATAGMLEIAWTDNTRQELDHALLRSRCQCADCRSLRAYSGQGPISSAEITVTDIRLVGNYAAQLVFSDGHERGIYPWAYLKTLGA